MHTLPFRQVHLDFHTSPCILDVGEEFDPQSLCSAIRRSEGKINYYNGHRKLDRVIR